jgi:hypothetical protein
MECLIDKKFINIFEKPLNYGGKIMYALKKLKGWEKLPPMTKEDVTKFRRNLEKTTEKAFKNFAKSKQKAWCKACNIVLD